MVPRSACEERIVLVTVQCPEGLQNIKDLIGQWDVMVLFISEEEGPDPLLLIQFIPPQTRQRFTIRKVRSRTLTADTTTNEAFGSFLCRASKKSGNWFHSSVGVVAGFAIEPIDQVLIGLDGNHLT